MGDFDTAGDSVEYLRVYRDPRFALDRYREVLVEDSFLHRPVVVVGRASNNSLLHGVSGQAVGDKARGGNVFLPVRF
jgi:hypothetical protein